MSEKAAAHQKHLSSVNAQTEALQNDLTATLGKMHEAFNERDDLQVRE